MGGTVPLSEHEQRQLEQIEQALYADHPRLARAMRAKDPKIHYRRRVVQAAIGFVVGIGLVVAGIFLKYHWLAAVGLVVMLATCVLAVSSYRKMAGMIMAQRPRRDRRRSRDRRRTRAPQASNGLMERIEERWRRRQEGNR
jgi:Protein of unknown function (DUF3040)